MKKFQCSILLVLGILALSNCSNPDYSWVSSEEGKSLLDLEYINDTLGLNLIDIRAVPVENENNYIIRLYLEESKPKISLSKHSFFLHFYPKREPEKDGNFSAVSASYKHKRKGLLIYEGLLNDEQFRFELIRYGLLNNRRNRIFTLVVDTIPIELRPRIEYQKTK